MTFPECYNVSIKMKNKDSFTSSVFLEQWLPRLIALAVLGYVIDSLFFKQDELSWLHVTTLAIVIALILAPMASRLKVLNLIDFNSKLNGLKQAQQETRNQLSELRSQISTVVSMRVSPTQIISLKGIQELMSNSLESKSQLATDISTKGREYTKEEFLRYANGYRHEAFTLLMLTRSFQIAINEHRQPYLLTEGNTMDEKIKNLVNKILEDDLTTVFPIMVTDEKSGEAYSVITAEIIEGVRQVNSLIDLYQKIQNGEKELPSPFDIDDLFSKVKKALRTIGAGLEVVGSSSVLYHYRMASAIKALEEEIKQADAEQRPIHLPKLNSD